MIKKLAAGLVALGFSSWTRAMPPFDPSQESQQVQETVQKVQKEFEHSFMFRIELPPGLWSGGETDPWTVPFTAIFPNGLRFVKVRVDYPKTKSRDAHTEDQVHVFPLEAAPDEKKGSHKQKIAAQPIVLEGTSMAYMDGVLWFRRVNQFCQALYPEEGIMTLSATCEGLKFRGVDKPVILKDMRKVMTQQQRNNDEAYWIIEIRANQAAEITLFNLCDNTTYENGYCPSNYEPIVSADKYILRDGKVVSPIIPLRWITDSKPKP